MKRLKIKNENGNWLVEQDGRKLEGVMELVIRARAGEESRPTAVVTFFNPEIEIDGDFEIEERFE